MEWQSPQQQHPPLARDACGSLWRAASPTPTFLPRPPPLHQALLLAVRTCYNIHLMSRSEVNQTTAKATLTQAGQGQGAPATWVGMPLGVGSSCTPIGVRFGTPSRRGAPHAPLLLCTSDAQRGIPTHGGRQHECTGTQLAAAMAPGHMWPTHSSFPMLTSQPNLQCPLMCLSAQHKASSHSPTARTECQPDHSLLLPSSTQLSQLLTFRRQVKPIAVADMLSSTRAGTAPLDAAGVAPAVQNFLNGVISMTGWAAAAAARHCAQLPGATSCLTGHPACGILCLGAFACVTACM
jgi:hypothetical protein